VFKVRDSDFYSWNEIVRKINGSSVRETYVFAEDFFNVDLITTYKL